MSDNKLQAIYDSFAMTYEKNRGLFDMSEVFEAFYSELGNNSGDLLDLGCGAGEPFARLFIEKDWKVTGVDFSHKMLELASRYVPEMESIHADMRQATFESASFDAIIATYSLFHIPREEHPALLQNFYRWLRPGGQLLFTYATKEYTGSEEFSGYKPFMNQNLFYSHERPERLYAILAETGFDIKSTDYREIGGEVFLWVTAQK